MTNQHEIQIRVRYQETDAMGRVHHANYINYFEIGRIELLRATGRNYRKLEEEGLYLVVSKMSCRYLGAARYDDMLRVRTTTTKIGRATVEHAYEVFRGEELIAQGASTVACVDDDGKVRRLPGWLREGSADGETQ
jgi:acyl-CoA thioester hydrolase